MEKSKLQRFIGKYHLNGHVPSIILNSKASVLFTRFISHDRSLLGEVSMKNWEVEDATIGILETSRFLKMLSIMDEDITLSMVRSNSKTLALKIKDGSADVHFMLTDTSVIEKAPDMKRVPEFTLKMELDKTFMKKFVAGKGALPDVGTFTVLTADSKADIVIGYSVINTNRVTIPTKVSEYDDLAKLSFNAEILKDIIVANSECDAAVLEVSGDGMAKIEFDVDGYLAKYWLVSVDNAS